MSFSPLLNNGLLNLAGTCSHILELLSQDATIRQEKKGGTFYALLYQYTYFSSACQANFHFWGDYPFKGGVCNFFHSSKG